MTTDARTQALSVLLGEWSMDALIPTIPHDDTRGLVTFEWMAGEQFLIERWEVPHPDAPDGVAIIGFDEGRGTYLQHYFDARGVARLYEMTLTDDLWTLTRTEPDFSPLDFRQRFTGRFEDGGSTIRGQWEINHGSKWEKDFDLTYSKVR